MAIALRYNLEPVLKTVNVPILITYGDSDVWLKKDISVVMAKMARKAILKRYRNVGHMAHWQVARRFNTDLSNGYRSDIGQV
jgi:pimeloyl-ACP methyl ester carboxylesterase